MNSVAVANQEEAASVAAEFLSSLDNIHNEVAHLLTEIQNKDTKAAEIQTQINKDTARYIRHAMYPKDGAAGASSSGGGTPTPSGSGSTPNAPPPTTAGSTAPPTTAASTATASTSATNGSNSKESKEAAKDALIPARVAENYDLLDALHVERIALAQRLMDTLSRVGARLDHDLGRVVQLSGENVPQEQYVVQGGYVVGTIPAGASASSAATATSGGVNMGGAASQNAAAAAAAAVAATTNLPPAVNVATPAPAPAVPAVQSVVQGGGLATHMSSQMPHGYAGLGIGASGTLPLGPPAQLAAMGLSTRGTQSRVPAPLDKAVESLRLAAGVPSASVSAGGGEISGNKRRKIGTGASSRAHTPTARGSRLALSSSARASPHPPSSSATAGGGGASAASASAYRRRAAASRKGTMVSDDDLEDRDADEDADADADDDEEGEGDSEDQRLYCFCQKTSYGEMVACDNATCPYQWFHLGCVGLTGKPLPDTFYCEECVRKGHGGAVAMGGSDGTAGGGGGGRKARRKV
ncbi:hypothetical protein SCHPADRAFT_999695 [Schizopora paradoxa]|uniref:Chromatin modification-related protein n=1 Tax=Schizopora paradoxa TaxID=27342 RepID=A0A0H2RZM5_9AGAM|nr:hypothetical protein SCHPADRAFT_999695 [Schizopora paradoxa]